VRLVQRQDPEGRPVMASRRDHLEKAEQLLTRAEHDGYETQSSAGRFAAAQAHIALAEAKGSGRPVVGTTRITRGRR
jgi:hypothetical protein